MNSTSRPLSLLSLAVMLFGISGRGFAQYSSVTTPTLGCQPDRSCPDRPISMAVYEGSAGLHSQIGVVSTGGMAISVDESAEVVKNQPYQAQAVTEMEQTLADGSHIAQTTTATVARDSDGRTVRIQKLNTMGPWRSMSDTSRKGGLTLTTIFDPVAKTHTDYTSDSKVAHVLPMPPPLPNGTSGHSPAGFTAFSAGPGGGGTGPATFSMLSHGDAPRTAEDDDKPESLGRKAIEGIPVTGTREVTTIPAGAIGNDKDLVITRDTWYSADLKLVIQSTQTDPRFGETSYSLRNIQRNEPDPSLFQVPSGYKVEKVTGMLHAN